MKNLDVINQKKQEIVQRMHDAIQKGDSEAFSNEFANLCQQIEASVMEQAQSLIDAADAQVLAGRGVRQLTSKEKEYYNKVIEAMRAPEPRQALANIDVVMPETVIDQVFTDLKTNHPLLSRIQFSSLAGLTKLMMNTNGYEKAAWGKLCAEIVQELTSGFKEVDVTQDKLSAFLPVCKAMLDLGPQWLDSYVRQVLQEALANGLEDGIINGTGKDQPIGMTKQVGDDVSVQGGVYPDKSAMAITKFDNIQLGNATAILAINGKGQARVVNDLIMLVNPQDYYSRVLPAIQAPAPGGGYISMLPFPIDVLQSAAVPVGKAVYGMAKLYFCGGGMSKNGRVEYSDEYHFLEDERVYLIKTYAHGFPIDNNAFVVFDITNLQPAYYKVETVDSITDVENAALNSLTIGGQPLTPAFTAATTTYTLATDQPSAVIAATPADATASMEITYNDKKIANGSSVQWTSGAANTVKVIVTDGGETKTYTVTVTYTPATED